MPVAIRKITKQYMAISPTMNDQWSGKILSSAERSHVDEPRRSSAQSSSLLLALGPLAGGRTLCDGAHDCSRRRFSGTTPILSPPTCSRTRGRWAR